MSALDRGEVYALYVAIGITSAHGERVTGDSLAKLLRRLEAMHECASCGSLFTTSAAVAPVCVSCAIIEQREDNERHDAQRDGPDYHAQPLAGGGR